MKNFFKYLSLISLVIITIVACETDFENVGANLVDNNTLNTDKAIFEVTAFTKNVVKSRVENTPVNSLGVYYTSNFGLLKAGVASQISLPVGATDLSFGINPEIDDVVLDIPYNYTNDGANDNGTTKFSLNNIYGNQDVGFGLRVSRLTTYLNALDPSDPTKPNQYFSNRTYTKSDPLYYNNDFKPNEIDTVLYVRRIEFDEGAQENYDTIKKSDLSPSIKLKLDQPFFKTNFVDNISSGNFENQDAFTEFFNGLLFESEEIVNNGSMLLLNFSSATLNIYYTNSVETDENGTDLNNNGTTDDENVLVRTKQTMTFGFNGIRTNTFIRDYSGSVIEPALDNSTENKKLFIQGAQGSLVSLDAFNTIDLTTIRAENWLINDASITLNIDQNASSDEVPSRLFLYKLDEVNDDINENAQVLDILTEGEAIYDGNLQNEEDDDDDATTENPLKYRFRITDYLSEILKNEDATQPVKLGIKAFHITDLPDFRNSGDTIVRQFSWDPRGVVLYGNDYLTSDPDYDKRIKLEIYYTKINN